MAKKTKFQKSRKTVKNKPVDIPAPAEDVSDAISQLDLPASSKRQAGRNWLYSLTLAKESSSLAHRYISQSLLFLAVPSLLVILGETLAGKSMLINDQAVLGGLCALVGTIWLTLNALTAYYYMLRAGYQQELKLLEVYRNGLRFVPRIFGFMLIFIPFFVISCLALIVPGLIVLRRYYLTPFYIIDYDCNIREAMRLSADHSKPYSYKIYSLLIFSIIIAGVTAFVGKLLVPYGSIVGIVAGTVTGYMPVCLYMWIESVSEDEKTMAAQR